VPRSAAARAAAPPGGRRPTAGRPRRARAVAACRKGVSAAEFAIIAVILFLTMLAVIDVSRYYVTMHSMRTVVAQAARALMINPTLATATRTCNSQALVSAAGGLGFVASTGQLCVTETVPQAGMAEVYIEFDAPFTFFLPIFGVNSVTIVERQRFRFAT
jgi:Flp pilus assembly protein TadG